MIEQALIAQAPAAGKDASWLFGLFGIETQVTNALVFLGIAIVVIALLGAMITLGVSGEQGKQKLKKKLPLAILAAVACFMGLGLLDVVVSNLVDAGTSVDSNKFNEILGG